MTHEQARTFVKEHIKYKGDVRVTTTETLVRYWWGVLNVAVFYGKLHKPVKVEIKGIRDSFAWAETNNKTKGRVNVRIQRKFLSKLLFLTILLHEMVHAWEHQHHTVMGHGKRFFAWKNRIKWTIGLDLKESHIEDDYRYE
jgi:fumarate reductase subunit D